MTGSSDTGIYVDDNHLTHGILFPGVNIFSQTNNGLCIFKPALHDYLNPKSELTIEQKNELDPLFKAIMDELDLDEDKGRPVRFEAGKLKDLLLDPLQQRRLTGIIAKHDNEWKKSRGADFKAVSELYRQCNQPEAAKRLDKRVADLVINLEVGEFNTAKQAYYLHPLAIIGALTPYSTCFCHRDFTVDEVRYIIHTLSARGVKSGDYVLFNHPKCPLEHIDRTYERLTEEINKTCRRYSINTCIRKMHFLAQIYLETASLKTTEEFASGEGYNPGKHSKAEEYGNTVVGDGPRYKGRGAMQLTWRKNYIKYFEYTIKNIDYYPVISKDVSINDMTNRSNKFNYLISEKLFLAFDSAGWYWRYGSVWGDLNKYADNDDVYTVNVGVNGGTNGFKERIIWLKKLINTNKIKDCQNLSLIKPLGIYKLSDSYMKNTKAGIKLRLEKYDD